MLDSQKIVGGSPTAAAKGRCHWTTEHAWRSATKGELFSVRRLSQQQPPCPTAARGREHVSDEGRGVLRCGQARECERSRTVKAAIGGGPLSQCCLRFDDGWWALGQARLVVACREPLSHRQKLTEPPAAPGRNDVPGTRYPTCCSPQLRSRAPPRLRTCTARRHTCVAPT